MEENQKEKLFAYDPLVAGAMRLGSWGANFDTPQYIDFIEGCVELGIHDFDHADIYGDYTTEAEFGAALKGNNELRQRIRLTTKCGIKLITASRPDHQIKSYELSKNHLISSVEQSLRNFHTDYLDVLLLHRPDVLMDPFEIAETFDELREQGKVLHFGVSNFSTHQFQAINSIFPLITNQVEVSVAHLDAFLDGTINQCLDHQIQPMAWSALGGGDLLSNPEGDRSHRIHAVLKLLGEKYDCDLDQLLYAFVLKHPAGIVPVLGTTKLNRIKKAVEALEIDISKEDWYRLWCASTGEEVA